MSQLFQIIILSLALVTSGWASSEPSSSPVISLEQEITSAISKKYPRAKIAILDRPSLVKGELGYQGVKATFLNDNGKAVARVAIESLDGKKIIRGEVLVRFSAFIRAPIALRRIRPKEKLSAADFLIQDVNVAVGLARDYRGLILSADENFDQLEAIHSIIEGHFPLMNGVRKIPDVRRGDIVNLRILSSSLSLSTTAKIEEPAYIGQQVRVLSVQTKKALVGRLLKNGSVEVNL